MIAFVLCCCMISCIKDEAPNNECDIESAWVEGSEWEKLFYKPADMRKENISSTETSITFIVRSMAMVPTELPVNFKTTAKATIEPASGSLQDFTKGPVTYTVTSEDGQWKRAYKVAFTESLLPKSKFSYENVDTLEGGFLVLNKYHQFYELNLERNKDSGHLAILVLRCHCFPEPVRNNFLPIGLKMDSRVMASACRRCTQEILVRIWVNPSLPATSS